MPGRSEGGARMHGQPVEGYPRPLTPRATRTILSIERADGEE
jgi:hypothetical protein